MKDKLLQPLLQIILLLISITWSLTLLIVILLCWIIGIFLPQHLFEELSAILWTAIPVPENEYNKDIYQHEDDTT